MHEIVFHGKGGYDWETVYNMPIWLRNFTFNKMKEWFDAEAKAKDPQEYLVNQDSPHKQISVPDAVKKLAGDPSYSTKAPKKK